jgi:hypothetical protein
VCNDPLTNIAANVWVTVSICVIAEYRELANSILSSFDTICQCLGKQYRFEVLAAWPTHSFLCVAPHAPRHRAGRFRPCLAYRGHRPRSDPHVAFTHGDSRERSDNERSDSESVRSVCRLCLSLSLSLSPPHLIREGRLFTALRQCEKGGRTLAIDQIIVTQ